MTISNDIGNSPPANPSMALIHTTSATLFKKICVESGAKLVPQSCPVMKVDLTYFFYGRPAYRPGRIEPTDRDIDSRPVCLLFKRDALQLLAGLYPCDTGAHDRGFYRPFLEGIDLRELDCVSVAEAEKKIVSRYFGNNANYFFGDQLKSLAPAPTSNTAQDFFEFLNSSDQTEYDDRSRTIEITTDKEIDLAKSLQNVILPDFLYADPVTAPVLETWRSTGVEITTYRPQSHSNAARTVERMFDTVAKFQGIAV